MLARTYLQNFMKNEFQNEQINFRVEKIQKQFENRLNDVDSNLEKMQKTLVKFDLCHTPFDTSYTRV